MKAFLKELQFSSLANSYLKDITKEINGAIAQANVQYGLTYINTKHTTLGLIVCELSEPNLLEDILSHTLKNVPEDIRSTRNTDGFNYPTTNYMHRCQDNPFCDEMDEDYNAAAHIRFMEYSHPSVTLPIRKGVLELGKYQGVGAFEFDGRDGTGKNPIRQRVVQIWIYEGDAPIIL